MQELSHSSIEDLIIKLQERHPNITISTIYRILDTFCEAGLLSKVNHPNGKIYYDIVPKDHHHIFSSNEQIKDFNDDELTEFIRQKMSSHIPEGEEIDKISIQIITKRKM